MHRHRRDSLALTLLTVTASLGSFLYFFLHDEILLYGDAVAHINIARRVFDSLTPGPLQLGTVWLPLPHVLTIPFVIWDWAWRTGAGGSVVSMAAYVAGVLGVARLFWGTGLSPNPTVARASGWMATLVYGANPNLLYLQATAMTEALSLALTIWALVFYLEFVNAMSESRRIELSVTQRDFAMRRARSKLEWLAIALAAGMLTRYDAWLLAGVAWVGIWWQLKQGAFPSLAKAAKRFFLLTALVPLLWLAYNFGVFGNPLEFAIGPYSARAIAHRSAQQGMATYPGERHVLVAALYFFKAAKLNLAAGEIVGVFLLAGAFGATWLLARRKFGLLTMLALPLLFYPLSMAYGGVPIFMPVWRPFSYYNVRYGLQLLPAFAVCVGILFGVLWGANGKLVRASLCGSFIALLATSYAGEWRAVPITLREARINSAGRIEFEKELAAELERLPRDATLLMYTGNHVGALQRAGIHLSRVINEGNYSIWQNALAQPVTYAQFVVAMQADPVWEAAQKLEAQLVPVARIEVPGQAPAVLYKTASAAR